MRVSIGIMAFNEAANIGKLLKRLVSEPLLNEVVIIADGCTDRTVEIANNWAVKPNGKVKLIARPNRTGKADAVNKFIESAEGDILILESADTLPSQFCFKYLLEPFSDKSVGMVGAHPIPVNSRDSLTGKMAHLLWEVHHQSALVNPKAGEVCAFRNVIEGIDKATPVDEASVEQQIVAKGYRVIYEPKAIVFNKGPETITDFMRQRKRIYHGHLTLRQQGYAVPTMSYANLVRAVLRATGKHYRTLAATVYLEMLARRQASSAFTLDGYKPTVWEVSQTTKEVN